MMAWLRRVLGLEVGSDIVEDVERHDYAIAVTASKLDALRGDFEQLSRRVDKLSTVPTVRGDVDVAKMADAVGSLHAEQRSFVNALVELSARVNALLGPPPLVTSEPITLDETPKAKRKRKAKAAI